MIIREILNNGNVHSYSDKNMVIRQVETGILYEDAIDIDYRYTYQETSTPIETVDDEYAEAGRILMGVSE